jgi:hypothetical protein
MGLGSGFGTRLIITGSLQKGFRIELRHTETRDAIARSTTVLALIAIVAIASISALAFLDLRLLIPYEHPGCSTVSGSGSATGAVVLADYLSVPSGGSYSSGDRDWQIEIGDLGNVGIKSVCATLTTDDGNVTQTPSGVPPAGSTSAEGAVAGGVQPGRSYPVSIEVVYDNGGSQLLRSSALAIAIATSPDTARVSIMNDDLYIPSKNGTVSVAFWTLVVGNTGTVTVSGITATLGLEPSNVLGPSVLNNIVPGDETSTGDGLSIAAFNIEAGTTYPVTFLVSYSNGQMENFSALLTAEVA